MDRTAFLRRLDWLSELGDEDWKTLGGHVQRHRFERGGTIFAPTPDPRSVYVLERGRVRICRLSPDGKEATLGYVEAGEIFGELAVFGDFGRDSYALAQQDCEVWRIPVETFRGWVRSRPKLVAEVTRQIGERMKRVESRVEHLILHDVRARLATVLLELSEDFGRHAPEASGIDLSQSELASLIGTSRQSVNAALSEFESVGFVHKEGRRVRVLDVEGLKSLSHSSAQ